MKAQALLGKQIISFDRGRIAGRVKDIIFDGDSQRMLGLVVVEPGVFTRAKAIPFDRVRHIGPDAVLIDSPRAIIEVRRHRALAEAVGKRQTLKDVRVVSEDGHNLGKISDIDTDVQSGKILGYIVSGGLMSDAYSGTSYLPAEHTMTIGRDVAIVPASAVQELESQVGGIKGAVQDAKSASEPKVRQLLESAKGKAKEGASQAKGIAGDVRESAGTAVDHLEDTAQTVKKKAEGLWANVSPELNRWRDNLMESIEERRIKAALGRPVTRVIFGKDDEVILDVGELVTHEAVDRARQDNALSMLLSSINRKPMARFDLAEI